MTTTDGNGIVFLQDTDNITPFHTLINTLQTGTSNAVGGLLQGTIKPVANNAGAIAYAASVPWTVSTSNPAMVWRADTQAIYASIDGTLFRRITDFAQISGSTTVSSTANPLGNPVSVTFPPGLFSRTPIVTATASNNSGEMLATVYDISAGGFTVNVRRTTGAVWSSGVPVYWHAVQATATSSAG